MVYLSKLSPKHPTFLTIIEPPPPCKVITKTQQNQPTFNNWSFPHLCVECVWDMSVYLFIPSVWINLLLRTIMVRQPSYRWIRSIIQLFWERWWRNLFYSSLFFISGNVQWRHLARIPWKDLTSSKCLGTWIPWWR